MLNPLAYCRECGCKILTEDDIGFIDANTDRLQPVGTAAFVPVKKRFVVCRACKDEYDRQWEEELEMLEVEYSHSFGEEIAEIEAGR